jgi:type II secretory pathway pseudopilin PulG
MVIPQESLKGKTLRNERGITLIELVVAISIVMIIAAAMGFQFSGWQKKYRIESEVRQIYTDIMNARLQAMQSNNCYFTVATSSTYQIFQDTNANCQYDAGTDTALPGYTSPKKLTDALVGFAWSPLTVDSRGLFSTITPPATITIQVTNVMNQPADYDCILVSQTRLSLGQMSDQTTTPPGGSCVPK